MSSAPDKLVEIKSKKGYLSPTELISQRHTEVTSPRIGLKRIYVEDSAAEQEELKNAYANLYRLLATRRIERSAGRAIAVWHENQQAAEVLRKDGKFESFGYSKQGKLYLEYYEAIFLLELNRLQLEYCDTIVSVEQAYVLLLGEAASEKYNNYLVYSTLSRAGYIVVKHQSAAFQNAPQTSRTTREDCIWALLEKSISNKPVSELVSGSTYYNTVKANMAELKQQIMSQSTLASVNESSMENDFVFQMRKRKLQADMENDIASKRVHKSETNVKISTESLLDSLKTEQTYLQWKQIFKTLEIVQLKTTFNETDTSLRSFKIVFDLHLHNEGFKRSAPKIPHFSIVILPNDEPFPTHDEIVKCQRQQLPHGAPLLIISVSESKQIQAFLYYVS